MNGKDRRKQHKSETNHYQNWVVHSESESRRNGRQTVNKDVHTCSAAHKMIKQMEKIGWKRYKEICWTVGFLFLSCEAL